MTATAGRVATTRPTTVTVAGWAVDVISVAVCVWYAALLRRGMDVNFDQLSYHYYYSWLLLHGGVGQVDPEPFTNRYVNPLPELPWYLLNAAFSPRVTAAGMGLLAGLNLPILRRITMLCLPDRIGGWGRLTLGAVSTLLGGTGVVFTMSLGTSLGDVLVTIPVLAALLILLRHRPDPQRPRAGLVAIAVAGLLVGIAVGAKLTMAPMAVGLVTVVALLTAQARTVWPLVVFGAGSVVGVGGSAGWWFAQVWSATGNPIFPYYNAVFRSTLWPVEDFRDERFGAGSLGGLLRLPIYMWEGSRRLLDYQIRDPRWVVLSALVLVGILIWSARHILGSARRLDQSGTPIDGSQVRTGNLGAPARLTLFFGSSALLWAFQFGIARYAITLELLTGTLFVLVLGYVVRREWVVAGVGVAIVAAMLPYTDGEVEHVPFASDRYGIQAGPLQRVTAGSVVLVNAYSAPSAFMLTKLPKGVRRHVVHPWFYGSPLLTKLKTDELSRAESIYVIQRDDWQNQGRRVRQFRQAVGVQVLPDTCVTLRSTVRDRVLCQAVWRGP